MVVLRLGKINNEERKFIPTKKEYLEKYLNGLEKIEKYELLQTYKDGYKYRRYNDNGEMKYTRNNKMVKTTEVIEISKEDFDKVIKKTSNWVRKIRKYYVDGLFEIDVDYFLEPIEMVMVEVSSFQKELGDYVAPKGFVEVSGNKRFENYGIYNGLIKSNRLILEGTDGVGKSVTIERLLDMNVEKYLLSSALTGIISQRLAKSLCPKCRVRRKTTPYEKKVFRLSLNKDIEEIFEANRNGCPNCNKGYKGRIAVHEVLEINDEIRNLINSDVADKEELSRLVYGTGSVITQLQDGLEKILEGLTTFEEIYRIIEVDNEIDENFKIMNRAVAENQRKEREKNESQKQQLIASLENNSQTEIVKNTQSIAPTNNMNTNQNNVAISSAVTSLSKGLIPNLGVNNGTNSPDVLKQVQNNSKVLNANVNALQNNNIIPVNQKQPTTGQVPVIPVANINTPVKAVNPTLPINNSINVPTFSK